MINDKVVPLEKLQQCAKNLRAAGKKLVATNGCFDLLHVGHIRYLSAARALGDALIVGINGSKEAIELIKNGKMLASGEFNGFVLGCLSTELATRNLRKQPVPQELVLKPAVYDKSNYEKYEYRVEMKKCPTVEEIAAE